MQSGGGRRGGRSGASIEHVSDFFHMVLTHRYSPFDPVSWMIAFIMMGMIGAVVVGHSALNGKACAPGFNPWNPNSYVRRAGCWVHWLLKDVPTDFQEDKGLDNEGAPNLIAPPSPNAPEVPGTQGDVTAPKAKRLLPMKYRNMAG